MICRAQSKTTFGSNPGFTLIEVMVSLTIMSLITAVAFTGLSVGIDSWHRGTRRIEELDRRFSLERLLQRQVAQAETKFFKGNGRELEFVSTYSLANGPGDPVRVKYSFESGKFVYSETSVSTYTTRDSAAAVTQTLGAFSQVAFRYFGIDEDKLTRVAEWTTEENLPAAVQAQIGDDLLTIPLANRK
jgi:prepilin-type N-terminal cleavage/methylation domain-containing protein